MACQSKFYKPLSSIAASMCINLMILTLKAFLGSLGGILSREPSYILLKRKSRSKMRISLIPSAVSVLFRRYMTCESAARPRLLFYEWRDKLWYEIQIVVSLGGSTKSTYNFIFEVIKS